MIDPSVCVNYILSGISIFDKKQIRRVSLAPLLIFLLMGFVPSLILGSSFLYIGGGMLAIAIICLLAVNIILAKPISIKNQLLITFLNPFFLLIELLLTGTMLSVMQWGWNWGLLWFYAVPVLSSICLLLLTHRMLLKCKTFARSKVGVTKIQSLGFAMGFLGMAFARTFPIVSQKRIIVVILLCFSILNALLSFCFSSLQKLYYLRKLSRRGVVCNFNQQFKTE